MNKVPAGTDVSQLNGVDCMTFNLYHLIRDSYLYFDLFIYEKKVKVQIAISHTQAN